MTDSFKQSVANTICERLAAGENLRTMCGEDGLPHERTVYRWLNTHEDFCQQYARARKTWADAQLEEVIAISKDPQLKPDDKRVQIDTLKWTMGKLNGKYSDKLKHVGGDEDDAPVRVAFTGLELNVVDPEVQRSA